MIVGQVLTADRQKERKGGETSRKRDAIVKIVCDCGKRKKKKKEETGQGIENGLSCQLRGDPYLLT